MICTLCIQYITSHHRAINTSKIISSQTKHRSKNHSPSGTCAVAKACPNKPKKKKNRAKLAQTQPTPTNPPSATSQPYTPSKNSGPSTISSSDPMTYPPPPTITFLERGSNRLGRMRQMHVEENGS